MKPEITALFTPSVFRDAAMRFGLDTGALEPLPGFENYVCKGRRGRQPCILRLTHRSHRSEEQISAELDWLNYLATNDVSVCRPWRSLKGNLVEPILSSDSGICAVVFERAPGQLVRRDDQTREMTVNRGRLLGRIHALTKEYTPPHPSVRRHHWHQSSDYVHCRTYLDSSDTLVLSRFSDLVADLQSLPQDTHSYGLIHTDAHTGNMFFDGNKPTLFDFDDCAYDFFISDIAISLFYAILFLPETWNREDYARRFLRDMFRGYGEENTLDQRWLSLIPTILKRREILLYIAIHRGFDMNNLDAWGQRYMNGRRERIENNVPVLDIDFTELA